MAKKYELGELVYKMTGDTAGLDKSIDSSNKKVGGFGSTLKGLAVAAAGILAGGALVNFFKSSSKAASDAEETASKFGVVFSKIPDMANKAADELAKSYGYSSTASKKLLSDTGNLLQGFGLGQEAALNLSDVVQRLSSDLVSFSNFSGGVEGASHALTAALMGETEAAKSLGLALGDEQLAQFGLKMGLNTEKMTMQEKAFLRIKLAVDQSKNAIGDYAATQESFANTMRKVDVRIEEIQTGVGKELNPGLLKMAKAFLLATESGGFLSDGIATIAKGVGIAVDAIANLINWLSKYDAAAKKEYGASLQITAMKRIDATKKEAVSLLQTMGDASVSADTSITELVKKLTSLGTTSSKAKALVGDFKEASDLLSKGQTTQQNAAAQEVKYADAMRASAKTLEQENKLRKESTTALNSRLVAAEKANNATKVSGQLSAEEQKKLMAQKQAVQDLSAEWGKAKKPLTDFFNVASGAKEEEVKAALENLRDLPPQIKDSIQKLTQLSATDLDKIAQTLKSGTNAEITNMVNLWGAVSPEIQKALQTMRSISPEQMKKVNEEVDKARDGFNQLFKQGKSFSELSFKGQFDAVTSGVNTTLTSISGLYQAMQNLESARLQHTLNVLDAQMEAELEAAGLKEDTAVEAAQKEYDAAVESGNAQTIAEKKKALDRAKIEEKYTKEKEKREYESSVRSWQLQLAMAKIQMLQAPLNAFTSSLTAPWPLNMILAPLNAAIALGIAMKNYQAVQEARPVASFAEGGIVPGSSYTGDRVPVQANSGELVATTEQQGRLMNILEGKSSASGTGMLYRIAPMDKQSYFDEIFRASQNGQLFIADRAVVGA